MTTSKLPATKKPFLGLEEEYECATISMKRRNEKRTKTRQPVVTV